MGVFAKWFKFAPSELWEFEKEDFNFWADLYNAQNQEMKKQMGK